jgi:hypothetical protein
MVNKFYKNFNYNKLFLNTLKVNRIYFLFLLFCKIFRYNFFFSTSKYNKHTNNVFNSIIEKTLIKYFSLYNKNKISILKTFNLSGANLFLFTNLLDDFVNLFNLVENKENSSKIYYKNGL